MTESSQRISEELKRSYPEVDWRSLSGFRNVLVHDYFTIDIFRLWIIVTKDIPVLKRQVEAMKAGLSGLGES